MHLVDWYVVQQAGLEGGKMSFVIFIYHKIRKLS
jgi:hypothetical protein